MTIVRVYHEVPGQGRHKYINKISPEFLIILACNSEKHWKGQILCSAEYPQLQLHPWKSSVLSDFPGGESGNGPMLPSLPVSSHHHLKDGN